LSAILADNNDSGKQQNTITLHLIILQTPLC